MERLVKCHINEQEDAHKQTGDEETLQSKFEDIKDEDCDLETATGPREVMRYNFNHLIHCNEIWLFLFIMSIFSAVYMH
jgi:hypothetical protein